MSHKTIGSMKETIIMHHLMERLRSGETLAEIEPERKKMWRMTTEQLKDYTKACRALKKK